MPKDKFTAVWVSHSSISDFLQCPRAYELKNVYKDPKTRKKVKLITPALALGQAVHETLESLSVLPTAKRFDTPLIERFHESWKKVSGKRGGFSNEQQEHTYKTRGEEMIRRVYNHPGPISRLAVKISQDLPYFWLSEEENIILCGKIDWLEYLEDSNSVHIIDFKTGRQKEDERSLQLPIYHLLVDRCQERKATKASYWYLASQDALTEKQLPSLEEAEQQILEIARKVKLARQLGNFKCKENGCFACEPFEQILEGNAEHVGEDAFGANVFMLKKESDAQNAATIL